VFDVAKQWASILTDEFANQGEMEDELGIPTCLFGGPPEPGNLRKLAESQIGFMSMFAMPLFEGVAALMPGMRFGVDELRKNKEVWTGVVSKEKAKE
jgi:3',5'-cyclic-nucleotide phosphodiesterase